MTSGYVHKILKHNDKYVIFYDPNCPWSLKALDKATKLYKTKKIKHRFYDITKYGGMTKILSALNKESTKIGFNPKHKTKPIVFYRGKFVGGFTEM